MRAKNYSKTKINNALSVLDPSMTAYSFFLMVVKYNPVASNISHKVVSIINKKKNFYFSGTLTKDPIKKFSQLFNVSFFYQINKKKIN